MNRLIESQELLRSVMSEAMGIYESKEPKVGDSWRDFTDNEWQLLQHAKHEFDEIERSIGEDDRFYHNCLDLINLITMMAARKRPMGQQWIIIDKNGRLESIHRTYDGAKKSLNDIKICGFYDEPESYVIK